MSNNNSSSRNSRINDTNKSNKISSEISEMNTETSISEINPTKLGTSEIDYSENNS